MPLEPDQMLSHYRLVEKIGEGGMGVVWRGHDTRLRRDVAIKMLPEHLSADAERLARFEREARTLASLNHPNVATLHGFERDGPALFLVMEMVEGEDLASRLTRGPLPVDEAIPLFLQIAEGLEAAHERGVIHRDLKPANIKITGGARAKILDFGLAKAMEEAVPGVRLSESPTRSAGVTEAGALLGTAPYMSPEQARGKPVDRRADVWAYGCVLYESLSGRPAFGGESTADTFAAILGREPDWSVVPARVGRSLIDLMRSCVVKDVRHRLRDIGDARIALERIDSGDVSVEDAAPSAQPSRALWIASILAAGILGAFVPSLLRAPHPDPPLRKLEVIAGETPEVVDLEPALSPDGTRIVYHHDERLWLRSLGDLVPRELPGTDSGRLPFWSPDSQWIGYFSRAGVQKISPAGGSPVSVASLQQFGRHGGAVWTEDDRILLTTGGSGLLHASAHGGELTTLLEPGEHEVDFHFGSSLPGGGIVFVVHSPPDVMDRIDAFAGGARRTLLQIDGATLTHPVYSPTGHLLFVRLVEEIGLWAVPFSAEKLRVTGEPFLVDPLGRQPTVSAGGLLAYTLGEDSGRQQLAWVDREGRTLEIVTESRRRIIGPRVSPDGRQFAFSEFLVGGADIWVQGIDGGNRSRISGEGQFAFFCDWSPDSTRFVYALGAIEEIFGRGNVELILRSADGGGEPRILGRGTQARFSPDGRYFLYTSSAGDGGGDLFLRPTDGGDETPLFDVETTSSWSAEISPDGKYVAYASDESGRSEIYVSRFPSGEGRWQVSTEGGARPQWSPRGNRLFFIRFPHTLLEVEVSTAPALKLATPRELFTAQDGEVELFMGFDAAADGGRFLAVRYDIPEPRLPTIAVVENWTAGLD